MSPAAVATGTVLGVLAWGGLGLLIAIAIGRSIHEADRRAAAQRRSCCPHPEAAAPPTVRGEFRAVVVPISLRSDPSSPGPERAQRRRPAPGEAEAPAPAAVLTTLDGGHS